MSSATGSLSQAQKALARAKSSGQSQKKIQEAAAKVLPGEKLYISLFIRDDPPKPDDFHWSLYYHQQDTRGWKYHFGNEGGGWMLDVGPVGCVFKSSFLCVLIEIASIPMSMKSQLDQLITSRNVGSNETPGFNRIRGLFMIVDALRSTGMLRCESLEALEEECLALGNHHMLTCAKAEQPRSWVASKLSP